MKKRKSAKARNFEDRGRHVLKLVVRMPEDLDDPQARTIAIGMIRVLGQNMGSDFELEATLKRHGDKHGNLLGSVPYPPPALKVSEEEQREERPAPFVPATIVGKVDHGNLEPGGTEDGP